MKVLILDRAVINGYSLGLASGLRDAGVTVVLGGPAASGVDSVEAVYPRADVAGRRARKGLDLVFGLARLIFLSVRFRPDVVHAQWPSPTDLLYVRLVRLLARARVVYTAHNPIPRTGEGQGRQDTLFRIATRTIVHSRSLAVALGQARPAMHGRIRVAPIGSYGDSVQRFGREEARAELALTGGGPVFAFVGRIRPYKGLETLLAAFASYLADGLSGTLVLAGTSSDPGYFASLRKQALALNLAPVWLTSVDDLPERTIDLVVSAATQVVLPFHEATQSASVMLALTHGRCAVSTSVGGIPEMVGDKAILVPPRDPVALREALALAARDPVECDRIGAEARAFVLERYTWAGIGTATAALYASAIPEARHGWRRFERRPGLRGGGTHALVDACPLAPDPEP